MTEKYIILALAVYLFICFCCYKWPYATPSSYLFLSNFFILDIPFLSLNTSKLFLLFSFFNIALRLDWKKKFSFFPFLFFMFLLPQIGFLIYYMHHHQYPPTGITHLKASWAFLFIFPLKNKVSEKQVVYFFAFYLLLSLALIFPSSFEYYLDVQRGLGRDLSPRWGDIITKLGGPLWPIMDDNVYENISLSLVSIAPFFFSSLGKNIRYKLAALTLFFFVFTTLYVNQFLITLLMLFFSFSLYFVLYLYVWPLFFQRHRKAVLVILGGGVLFIVALMLNSSVQEDFIKRFDLNPPNNALVKRKECSQLKNIDVMSVNRMRLFSTVLRCSLHEMPFWGRGELSDYGLIHDVHLKLTHTGHSTLIDLFLSFGPFAFLFLLFFYLYPLFLVGKYLFKVKKKKSGLLLKRAVEYQLAICVMVVNICILSVETIYGREALQLTVMITLAAVVFHLSREERKEEF